MRSLSKQGVLLYVIQTWYATLTCGLLQSTDTPHQMLFWGHTAEEPPTDKITIGHENTGYVVGVGKDVKGFKVGDLVGCLGCSYACCTWTRSRKQFDADTIR